jgi:hypothetical protein
MVYVNIYLQDPMITEAKRFKSVEACIKYCFKEHKANYITFEYAADNSFDYYVRLND